MEDIGDKLKEIFLSLVVDVRYDILGNSFYIYFYIIVLLWIIY